MSDSMDIHIESTGRGQAILWIHGYTMDSTVWYPLWELLPGFRHIGIDLPGHGRSGPLSGNATLPALAARVAEIVKAEDAPRIVGLSFGSCVALHLAVAYPSLVTRLALAAPTIAGGPPAAGAVSKEMQLSLLHRMAGPGRHMTRLWMTSPPDIFRGTEHHPELRDRLRRVIDGHGWAELENRAMRSLGAYSHTDTELGRISAATLVLTGDEDMPEFRANASRLTAIVPDCTPVRVPQAGHLCLLERPAEVIDQLRAHLAAS